MSSIQCPILLLGPCSAESELQIWQTASALQQIAPHAIFRAGLWKPRTSPTAFAGVGEKGLSWLLRVQNELHLPVATEVVIPEHITACIEAGITHLWIGARTTANPIMVQALADACQQILTQTPQQPLTLYIKNPINPDIALWVGAIERLQAAGVQQIYAIHRGFSTLYKSEWRNAPIWSIPIELRRRFPNLPIICDPSHITGNANRVHEIATEAMKLGLDGLMIECHHAPEHALSDSQQQLTPTSLQVLLSNLSQRIPSTEPQEDTTLLALRQQIDEIDNELWQLLAQRLNVAQQIGQYKQKHQMPILQRQRYEDILQKRIRWAESHHISEETVRKIMEAIHTESVKRQL